MMSALYVTVERRICMFTYCWQLTSLHLTYVSSCMGLETAAVFHFPCWLHCVHVSVYGKVQASLPLNVFCNAHIGDGWRSWVSSRAYTFVRCYLLRDSDTIWTRSANAVPIPVERQHPTWNVAPKRMLILQITVCRQQQCCKFRWQFVLVAWDSVTVSESQRFYVYINRKLHAEKSHKFSLQLFAPHKLTTNTSKVGGRKSCKGRCFHGNWCPSNCIVSCQTTIAFTLNDTVQVHQTSWVSWSRRWWSLQTLTGNQRQHQQLLQRSAIWVGPAANCATFLPGFITCLTLCSPSTRWHRPRKTPKMYTTLCCGTVRLTRWRWSHHSHENARGRRKRCRPRNVSQVHTAIRTVYKSHVCALSTRSCRSQLLVCWHARTDICQSVSHTYIICGWLITTFQCHVLWAFVATVKHCHMHKQNWRRLGGTACECDSSNATANTFSVVFRVNVIVATDVVSEHWTYFFVIISSLAEFLDCNFWCNWSHECQDLQKTFEFAESVA